MDSMDMVREFHEAYGCDINETPYTGNKELSALRLNLLIEEMGELMDALNKRDTVETLDALTDIQYVLDGAYLALGFADYKQAALEEVHRANMSKLGEDGKPVRREDGKVMKGPNYEPPNLRKLFTDE